MTDIASSKRTIVLVEDDPDIGGMLSLYFQTFGYDVHVAESGWAGVNLVSKILPGVVLLDVMLPDIDGYRVLQEIRQNSSTRLIPIIFLTQRNAREDRLMGLGLGAVDFIGKPFDLGELQLRVERVFRQQNQHSLYEQLTGLPGRVLLTEKIRELQSQTGWLLLFCHIQSLDSFRDAYGFLAMQQVLASTTAVMQQAVQTYGSSFDFLAQVGDTSFALLTFAGERLTLLIHAIQSQFSQVTRSHYSFFEREQGHFSHGVAGEEVSAPLMSIQVQVRLPREALVLLTTL